MHTRTQMYVLSTSPRGMPRRHTHTCHSLQHEERANSHTNIHKHSSTSLLTRGTRTHTQTYTYMRHLPTTRGMPRTYTNRVTPRTHTHTATCVLSPHQRGNRECTHTMLFSPPTKGKSVTVNTQICRLPTPRGKPRTQAHTCVLPPHHEASRGRMEMHASLSPSTGSSATTYTQLRPLSSTTGGEPRTYTHTHTCVLSTPITAASNESFHRPSSPTAACLHPMPLQERAMPTLSLQEGPCYHLPDNFWMPSRASRFFISRKGACNPFAQATVACPLVHLGCCIVYGDHNHAFHQ